MKKIYDFVKKHFLTKKFLTFGIIGVMNTGIHLLVYHLCYDTVFHFGAFISNSIAFITATVFSYFANATFTFRVKKRSTTQFSVVILVYLIRLGISSTLTWGFDSMFLNWFHFDYMTYPILELMAPLLGSALLIPIAYFALDWVFKTTDKKKEEPPL